MSNKTVRNEQRKLTAGFVNGIALAAIAVGGFAQVATFAQGGQMTGSATIFALVCIAAAASLHFVARTALKGLEE